MIPCVCPTCHAKLQAPDAAAGKQMKCPNCKNPLAIPASNAAVQVAQPPVARPPSAPTAIEGQKSRSAPIASAPVAAKKSSPSITRPKSKPQYDDVEVDETPVRGKSKKKGKQEAKSEFPWLLVGIGGGVGLLVLILVGGILILTLGSSEPKRPGPIAANQKGAAQKGPADKSKPFVQPQPQPAPEPVAINPIFEAPNGPLPPELTPEAMKKVKKATVQLQVKFANGGAGEGSGFFAIDRNLVVTNAHVVGMLHTTETPRSIDIVVNSGEPEEYRLTGTILGVDHDADLAIVKLIGDTSKVPPPLNVDHVSTLSELQKVYIFGFPLGSSLGKSITISSTVISSIRRDNDGQLTQVQVNGGMAPGNSGGPVVDSRGNVIGVSVAVIRGTQINFAVPAEKVKQLSQGRVLTTDFGHSYRSGTTAQIPFKLTCLDPLEQISRIEVDYWFGPNDASRPGTLIASARRPSDGPKQTASIQYADGEGKGDLPVPMVAPGQALWAQPVLHLNSNQKVYAPAVKTLNASSTPLERTPANLTLNFTKAPERTLDVSSKMGAQIPSANQKIDIYKKLDADFLETVTPRGADFSVSLSPNKTEVTGAAGDKSMTFETQAIELFRKFNYTFVFAPSGKLLEVGSPVWSARTLPAVRTQADDLVAMLHNAYQVSSITFPNRQAQPMETWTTNSTILLNGGNIKIPIDISMKCTFEGVRSGKDAVIRLDGDTQSRFQGRSGGRGRLTGHTIVDIERGFVSKSQVTVRWESETDGPSAVTTMEATIARVAGNPRNIKPAATSPSGSIMSVAASGIQPVGAGKAILEKAGRWKPSDPKHSIRGSGHQAVPIALTAGKVYVFDLMSTSKKEMEDSKGEFDPFLAIEDPSGQVISVDDDGGGFPNAHIVLRAPATGQYRIIVTAFEPTAREGGYTLRVGEVEAGAEAPAEAPKMAPKGGPVGPKKVGFTSQLEIPPADRESPLIMDRFELAAARPISLAMVRRTPMLIANS